MKWRWVAIVLLASVDAWAQEVTTISLVTDAACADVGVETDFVRELRQRLPDTRFILGEAGDAAWQLTWRPDGETCVVNVEGIEPASIAVPQAPNRGDLELAASQVAWIVTMATAPVDPERDPTVETAPQDVPKPEPEPEPEPEPTPEPVPEPQVEPTPTAELTAQTEDPQPDITPVGMVFTLVPPLTLPTYEADNVVPSMAVEVWSPGHYGVDGIELALVFANAGFVDGIQASVFVNRSGDLNGIQAGFFNWADDVEGIQAAWGANVSNAALLQVASGANIALGDSSVQIAAGVNIADDVDLQVASVNVGDRSQAQVGVVNVADRASVQVGVVNISETSDVPIGLINIMTDEPAYATGWITSQGMVVAGVLHGGKRLRYMYLVAGAPSTDAQTVGGAGLGLSGHFDFSSWFIDVEAMGLQVAKNANKQSFLFSTHVIAGWQIAPRFAVFAGPGLSTLWTTDADKLGLPPDGAASQLGDGTTPDRYAWLEFHAGVRF